MIDDTYIALTPREMQDVKAFILSLPGSRFRAPFGQDAAKLQPTLAQPRTALPAAIAPSMRAFNRALRDACAARIYRAKAAVAACPRHRFRLIQTARQCEARVRYAADMALRSLR